ncbi:MAG: glycosyltransferase [Lutibacter sp.]|uniref:glycosyltransferase n=1 Tax=Lutibacter sp. TaxID=1925666 RepID=UPI0017AD849C|nr:glycosyltransferase [Lutibacter sp.]MBT8318066.1 glycosyltransferase [Lutibacter sp.]NNJ58926.1 glycosyltransferase [Lutibacter sp.]
MVENLNKKILFIINGLGYGGAETHLLRLSNALLLKGWNVSLLTLTDNLSLEDELDSSIKHYKINLNKKFKLINNLRAVIKIVKLEQPTIIHSHLFQSNVLSRFIKFFNSKIKIVNTTHCVYDNENILGLSPYVIYKLTKNWVNFHTAVSKESLHYLIEKKSIKNKKSLHIVNGLIVEAYKKTKIVQPNKVFRWLSIGRLIPVKNYKSLIIACKNLINKSNKFQLDIAGEGFEKSMLEELIKENKLEKYVRLIGISDNVPKLLSNYNAFVISSNSEGLPMVLLEAMASSLPVVSTNVGEISSILKASKGGYVVEPKNTIELSQIMYNVMKLNNEELKVLGKNNLTYVKEKFDINTIVNNWIKIYNM